MQPSGRLAQTYASQVTHPSREQGRKPGDKASNPVFQAMEYTELQGYVYP